MSKSLNTTFEILGSSRNEASLSVLLAALDSAQVEVFEGAIKTLVSRRSRAGHFAVVSRWHQLSEPQRDLVRQGRGKMSGGLRNALLAEDTQYFTDACEIIEEFGEFDLVATLVTLSENRNSMHSQSATEMVSRLVKQLSEMVHGKRESQDRRDPNAIRKFVMESLEHSVERFREHQREELIEAFVVLGGRSCELLRTIIEDPHHACYMTVVNTLTTSESSGVIDLLLSFLDSELPSLTAIKVISRRTDKAFLSRLLELADGKLSSQKKRNLSRIRNFAWLQTEGLHIVELEEQDQARSVALLSASGIDQEQKLALWEILLRSGKPAARLAVCESLDEMQGDHTNQLILTALEDKTPQVQAAATLQLRDRNLPGSMSLLLKLIDSPHDEVREAAGQSLGEFTFENFLSRFDTLHDDTRQSTGTLVCKVDHEVVAKLRAELESTSRKNRMRAIEMAEAMAIVSEVSDELVQRLEDEDHLVRAAAADALQFCPTAEVQEALRFALNDRSSAVQNAARNSLNAIEKLNSSNFHEPTHPVEGQS